MASLQRSESPPFTSAQDAYHQINIKLSSEDIEGAMEVYKKASEYEIWTETLPMSCSYATYELTSQNYQKEALKLIQAARETAAKAKQIAVATLNT